MTFEDKLQKIIDKKVKKLNRYSKLHIILLKSEPDVIDALITLAIKEKDTDILESMYLKFKRRTLRKKYTPERKKLIESYLKKFSPDIIG